MIDMAPAKTITVSVSRELVDQITKLARETNETESALAEYVANEEWRIRSIRKGIEDAQAGRMIPHEKVRAWLESWGTEDELPPPTCE